MRQQIGLIVWLALACHVAAILLFPSIAVGQESRRTLKSGWYSWDPYQYLDAQYDLKRLTGLDVRLVSTVFAQMGYEVLYEEVGWKQHQSDVKNGVRDIAAGAFKNPERAEYAYFSAPYRKEDRCFVHSQRRGILGMDTVNFSDVVRQSPRLQTG